MNLDKKTCPYCGKRLVLAPPSHEYFPESMGVSKNGVEFCAGSVRRLSYTLDPDPDHYREWILTEKLWFEQNKVHQRRGGYWRRTQHSLPLRCVSAEHIRRHIEKGGLSLYKWDIWFMCANCHKKLAVNFNPFRLMRMHVLLFLAAALLLAPGLLFFIAAIEVGRPELLWIPPVIYAGIIAVIFLIVFGILKYIEGHFSNFAPVSEFDCLARLTTDLTASWCELTW